MKNTLNSEQKLTVIDKTYVFKEEKMETFLTSAPMRTQEFWNLLIFEVPGADSGVRVSGNGQKKKKWTKKTQFAFYFSSPMHFSFSPVPTYPRPAIFPWVSEDGSQFALRRLNRKHTERCSF